jgi:hypothetical protein
MGVMTEQLPQTPVLCRMNPQNIDGLLINNDDPAVYYGDGTLLVRSQRHHRVGDR